MPDGCYLLYESLDHLFIELSSTSGFDNVTEKIGNQVVRWKNVERGNIR